MQGESQRKGIQLNICPSTVNMIWMRYKRTGRTDNWVRSGRPRITTEKQRRHFCRLSMISPFSFPRKLIPKVIFENHISLMAARRILCESGLFRRIAARKLLLNKIQKRKRILFCKAYRQIPMLVWKSIIFTDEMKLELYGSRRACVRGKVRTRFHNRYVC